MPHIKRAVAFLALLLILVFVVPRIMPKPALLVDFGFHTRNSAQNADKWASHGIKLAFSTGSQAQ